MALPRPTRQRGLRSLVRSSLAMAACTAVLSPVAPVLAQPTNPDDGAIARVQSDIAEGTAAVSGLAGEISRSQEQVNELELEIGALRESVNKALVDLHDTQATAEQARQAVLSARERLDGTQAEMDKAQESLNEISRSTYRNGAKSGAITEAAGAESTEDALDRRTFLRVNAEEQRDAIEELDELRTRQANEESQLRKARDLAEEREAAAESAKIETEGQIRSTSTQLAEVTAERDRLAEERSAAQAELDQSRQTSGQLNEQRQEYQDYLAAESERKEAEAAAAAERRQAEDEAERAAAEAASAGDSAPATAPEGETTAATEGEEPLGAVAQYATEPEHDGADAAAATLVAENTPSHTSLDSPYPSGEDHEGAPIAAVQNLSSSQSGPQNTDPGLELQPLSTFGNVSKQARENVTGSREEQIETVIDRAASQIGMPYAWGGGDANGPTRGIRDGGVADRHGDYKKVGFDCSGLMVYAFAGVGIALPHYTGYQYQHGEKVEPSEMQRGDLIFYGPEAEHHVAIYLGDGKMLEAPQSGSHVKVSDVRWSGMSPSAVRLI